MIVNKNLIRLNRFKIDFKKLYLRFMNLTQLFERIYQEIRVDDFESRFLPFSKLKFYLDLNYPEKKLIGKSFLDNEIYLIKIGNGNKKVFCWSQMHGNESTGTRAMLDVFEFLNSENELNQKIKESVSLYYVPMLNPDGSNRYSRRNASGIDLNRDYIKESSTEIRALKRTVNEIKPDFLFNLHDQRSIFNVSGSSKPATLSFLAPSPDVRRSVTEVRKKSMDVIGCIYNQLETVMPGHIARFSDEFYPTSTGDNFMKAGFSNLLIEAGHFPNDYQRNEVRRFNALAILLALEKISDSKKDDSELYQKIPENDNKSLDIVLRNVSVKSKSAESLIDIGIYFEEKLNLKNQEIEFHSRIEEIGDLSAYFGHLDLDMEGRTWIGKDTMYPKIGKPADFSVGSIHFENGVFIG